MTHASLFSGIGGFDLAAAWVGWENAFYCETDPFCRKILEYHFPKSTAYGDIKESDFTIWRGKIDVLTGGFPCQPFSLAGKRKGTADNRYLWPEMLRAVSEIQPRWVVGENVLGIVNWSNGMVFEQVHANLEAKGYEVASYILPACGVGAPHQRYRTWFVAHRADAGIESMRERADQTDRIGLTAYTYGDRRGKRTDEQEFIEKCKTAADIGPFSQKVIANADGQRCKKQSNAGIAAETKGKYYENRWHSYAGGGIRSADSRLNPLFVAEMMGFPKDWTVSPFLHGAETQ